jgi:hypothetical protein
MRRRMIPWIGSGALLLAGLVARAAPAPVQRIERFAGAVRVGDKDVQVAIDTWLLPNATKVDALSLPLKGSVVVELRGGSIVTIIEGHRQSRTAGDFWALPAGSTMGLETGDDSAALQTTVVNGGR